MLVACTSTGPPRPESSEDGHRQTASEIFGQEAWRLDPHQERLGPARRNLWPAAMRAPRHGHVNRWISTAGVGPVDDDRTRRGHEDIERMQVHVQEAISLAARCPVEPRGSRQLVQGHVQIGQLARHSPDPPRSRPECLDHRRTVNLLHHQIETIITHFRDPGRGIAVDRTNSSCSLHWPSTDHCVTVEGPVSGRIRRCRHRDPYAIRSPCVLMMTKTRPDPSAVPEHRTAGTWRLSDTRPTSPPCNRFEPV